MNTQDLIISMKNVDWYFEYIEGDLLKYRKALSTYKSMIEVLKTIDDKELVKSLISEYVPQVTRAQALKDARVQ